MNRNSSVRLCALPLLLFSLLLVASPVLAQETGTVTGTVTRAADGRR